MRHELNATQAFAMCSSAADALPGASFGLLPPAVEGLAASQCEALANAAGLTAQELGRETCAARKALDAFVKSGGHVKRTATLCCACEAEFRRFFVPQGDSHTCGHCP